MKVLHTISLFSIVLTGALIWESGSAFAGCYSKFSNSKASVVACEYDGGSGYLKITNKRYAKGICYEVTFRSGRTQKGCFRGGSSKPSCFRCKRSTDGVSSVSIWERGR